MSGRPQAQSFYPDDKTFYINNSQPRTDHKKFDPSRTKQDFPDIKTRGKVFENRVDLELERQGNILTQGRDEKSVFQTKREQEQNAMREALQKQIEEKQRKKDLEKEKNKQHDLRDDIRIRDEMKAMAIAEGMGPQEGAQDVDSQLKITKENSGPVNPNLMASQGAKALGTVNGARRTAYVANQHSVSIIGSDIGKQYLPENLQPNEGQPTALALDNEDPRVSQSPHRLQDQGPNNQMMSPSAHNIHHSPFKENNQESLQGLVQAH